MTSVLIVSQDPRFLDRLGAALQHEGMLAVCVEQPDAVVRVAQEGLRPRAIVVDPDAVLEPGGGELVRLLIGSPMLAPVPIFSISAAVKRLELARLIGELRLLCA